MENEPSSVVLLMFHRLRLHREHFRLPMLRGASPARTSLLLIVIKSSNSHTKCGDKSSYRRAAHRVRNTSVPPRRNSRRRSVAVRREPPCYPVHASPVHGKHNCEAGVRDRNSIWVTRNLSNSRCDVSMTAEDLSTLDC